MEFVFCSQTGTLLGNGGVMLDNSFGFARNFEGSAVCTETAVKWFGVQDGMTAGVNDNALLQNTFYGNGLLATQDGLVKIQDVVPGMIVLTRDNGYQKVSNILRKPHVENASDSTSVLIKAGALAPSSPKRDVVVAEEQLILVTDRSCAHMCEVFEHAKALTSDYKGIRFHNANQERYFIEFEQHEIIQVDGIWMASSFRSESSHPVALNSKQMRMLSTAQTDARSLARPLDTPSDFEPSRKMPRLRAVSS